MIKNYKMKMIWRCLMVLVITSLTFTACKKMDSTYGKFIVPGGITYVGKATSPIAYDGKNRVKIIWLRGSDPNATKARIFWNNYADSVEINIPPVGDTISYIFDNLAEKSYSFVIKTYDAKGHSSIPVELSSTAYGNQYQSSLLSRPVNSSVLDAKGKITINWGGADISNGAFETEVKYTDTLGNSKNQFFPISESTSTISDLKPGSSYQYRTMFKPDSLSIDEFFTGYSESGDFSFDKKDWKIAGYSDQLNTNNAATFIIDGIPEATRWHTNGSPYPHWAIIDMGAVRTITKFGVWRTTVDPASGDTRAPMRIQFLISMDNITWTDLGSFDFNNLINGEHVYPTPTSPIGRYFKFVGLAGNNYYMTLGEISAYGY